MHDAQLINPNFHIVLVHYPIALLFLGTLIEVFSFLGWRRSSFRSAGRWMIFLGVLSGIPTALAGLYAMNDVIRRSLPASMDNAHWADALAASALVADGRAWAMLKLHAWLNAGVTGVLTLAIVAWVGGSDTFRRFMYVPVVLLLVLGLAAISAGAWYGGEMVYTRGVGVAEKAPLAAVETNLSADPSARRGRFSDHVPEHNEQTKTISDNPTTELSTTEPTTTTSTTAPTDARRTLGYYLPPMQMHVILAGFTIAMAMAALAASFRRANVLSDVDRNYPTNYPPRREDPSDFAAAFGARPGTYGLETSGPSERFSRPGIPADDLDDSVPAARFWLLAFLLSLCTASFGAWIFIRATGVPIVDLVPQLESIWKDDILPHRRRLLHVLSGSAIIILPLLLAMVARWAPRQKIVMFIIALWLLSAVALQVWLGTLLLWDGPEGPWNAFHVAVE